MGVKSTVEGTDGLFSTNCANKNLKTEGSANEFEWIKVTNELDHVVNLAVRDGVRDAGAGACATKVRDVVGDIRVNEADHALTRWR